MKELKVLELFGGIGACSKALERLNIEHEVVDYVEIDKYAVKSYNAIHETNFEPQDITQWDKQLDVDLIMHGSPCQDFSLAGKQAGGDEGSGTRSSLLYETIRIVEKLKPKYVIWENVKNVISKKHRHNFDNYLSEMEKLGYKNYFQVLNAKDYGIPQNRERVFTISILDNYTEKYEKISVIVKDFTFPTKQELTLRLKDMLEDEVDEKYYLSEDKINSISHWKAYQKPFEKVQGKKSIVPTLTARGAGEEHSGMITYSDSLDNTTNLQDKCLNIKEETIEYDFNKELFVTKDTENYIEWKEKGKLDMDCRAYKEEKVGPTLHTKSGNIKVLVKEATKKGYAIATQGDSINISQPNSKTRRGRVGKGVAQTLLTQPEQCVIGTYQYAKSDNFMHGKDRLQIGKQTSDTIQTTPKEGVAYNDLKIRKLTPKECFRLMGFDDEDYEKASQVNSNAQLYKQAGNSIVVNVLEEILKELFGGINE